jgi:hypothetical protein
MPMILRSGRAKNSLPPVIRPRLPPLVRRHDTEFPGPVFSAQRNARQYTQWEVDISQHLALPETLDYFENSLRATVGDAIPMQDAVFAHEPRPDVALQQDANLVSAIVQHTNRALRAFRRREPTPVRIVLTRVAAVAERTSDNVFKNVESLDTNGEFYTENHDMGSYSIRTADAPGVLSLAQHQLVNSDMIQPMLWVPA